MMASRVPGSLRPYTGRVNDMAKILIADDEREIRDLVRFILEFEGYQVMAACTGEEAIGLALQEKPDLILMDVRMPRMTGYEACRLIRAEPALRDVPVMFLSARGQDEEIRAGLEAGANEYLLKPISPDLLAARVKDLIGNRL